MNVIAPSVDINTTATAANDNSCFLSNDCMLFISKAKLPMIATMAAVAAASDCGFIKLNATTKPNNTDIAISKPLTALAASFDFSVAFISPANTNPIMAITEVPFTKLFVSIADSINITPVNTNNAPDTANNNIPAFATLLPAKCVIPTSNVNIIPIPAITAIPFLIPSSGIVASIFIEITIAPRVKPNDNIRAAAFAAFCPAK